MIGNITVLERAIQTEFGHNFDEWKAFEESNNIVLISVLYGTLL